MIAPWRLRRGAQRFVSISILVSLQSLDEGAAYVRRA